MKENSVLQLMKGGHGLPMLRGVVGVMAALMMVLGAGCGNEAAPRWVKIPGGVEGVGSVEQVGNPPRDVVMRTFELSATEVTVGQFERFLREEGRPGFASEQFEGVGKDARAVVGRSYPVHSVTVADAEAYAAWLGNRLGRTVRLPTADEWEVAARGGVFGARYPWGWGEPERSRARWNAAGAAKVGRFPRTGYGLFDMAGNLAEWAVESVGVDRKGWLMGGSWADTDPGMLRVDTRIRQPLDYSGPDVGFRVLKEGR
ncbi:MAG TPA: SUMF1/EgtB/PvdO family nonheme iron enzyme [Kiritimatiellia bacterium]|nr:SUMF1/EgtB/PvdO family nonheme iron enzyme [Kiritimatiellia bacterium]